MSEVEIPAGALVQPCQVCGRLPTAQIGLTRNVGLVIVRRSWSYRGFLCREHGRQLARNWLLATVLMGWWGFLSFFVNFGAVATDLGALRAAGRLGPPRSAMLSAGSGTVAPSPHLPLPNVSSRQLVLAACAILIVVIGSVTYATFGPKAASELEVGDCFDAPTTVGSITEVPHHPCSMAHSAEVFALANYTGGGGNAYPTDAEFRDFATTECGSAFESYTGGGAATGFLDIGYLTPTADGWATGDRKVLCYLAAPVGQTLNRSFRTAAP